MLELYVQCDAHVQQVVVEKISVECNMATREGRMVKESNEEYVMKMGTEKEEIPVLQKRGRKEDHQQKVVGWLEINEGSIQGGHSLSRPLKEGE